MGNCLGFGPGGIIGGSCASVFQSVCYGGYTPAGGVFAFCQSQGARGCGVLSGWSSLLTFLTGGLLLGLGVTIGFYPDNIGITNDRDITKFAEDATDLDILPLYKYMITVGVFMLASTLLYFCCVKFFSAISLILTMVFLGLTANSIGDMNQYKILPPSATQTHQLNVLGSLDGLYIGDNPYPRRVKIFHSIWALWRFSSEYDWCWTRVWRTWWRSTSTATWWWTRSRLSWSAAGSSTLLTGRVLAMEQSPPPAVSLVSVGRDRRHSQLAVSTRWSWRCSKYISGLQSVWWQLYVLDW